MNNQTVEATRVAVGRFHTADYLTLIGVAKLPPLTSPFDPGYDPATLESQLDQSAHSISGLPGSNAAKGLRTYAVTQEIS